MKTFTTLVLLMLSTCGHFTPVLAEQRTFHDSMGRTTGRAVTNGNATTFYDSLGRNTGRSVTDQHGNITHFDSMGRRQGTVSKR